MLFAELYLCIIAYLARKDLDTLLLVSRHLGSLSQRASRARPRRISLHQLRAGQFDLDFEEIRRAVAFDDLPIYLHGSQLTEVCVDGTMLNEGTTQALHVCKSYYSYTTLLSVRSISGRNEQSMLDAFADTLVASRMRLHVSDGTLTTHLITWTGVKLCSDLHYTLNDDWMPPQAVIGWLLATKLRTGPLRLYVHITAVEDWYGNWERSLQKLLKGLCDFDYHYPAFDCQLIYEGARGIARAQSDYELRNARTGQNFDVRICIREVHTGFFVHTVCISCRGCVILK